MEKKKEHWLPKLKHAKNIKAGLSNVTFKNITSIATCDQLKHTWHQNQIKHILGLIGVINRVE
jgi:hypothetical protein